jgi:hypothetical protein
MKEKKPHVAPRGNQNARKHGFYSQVLDEAQTLQLDEAREVEGLDEEIAVLRVKLLALINDHPDRIDLQVIAASTIAKLIRTRHIINSGQKKSLKDAMTRVLTEIAVPLGLKAIIQ